MQSLLLNNSKSLKIENEPSQKTKLNQVVYLVTSNLLTITVNGKTDFISKAHPLFDKLVEFLPKSSEFIIEDNDIRPSQQLKEAVYYDLTSGIIKNGAVDGIVINNVMAEKIVNLLAQDLPYQPLLKVWVKLQNNPYLSKEDKAKVLETAATTDMPITWAGDLVLYARANMNRNQMSELVTLTNVDNLLGDIGRPKVNKESVFKLGLLAQVSSMCTDAGVMSDWLVDPAEIKELKRNFYSALNASKISTLTERYGLAQSKVLLDASSLGGLVIRDPHNAATSLAALPHQQAYAHKAAVAKLESAFKSASC
jgi:hypothetical protein